MINNNTERHSTANNNTHEKINSVKQAAENHQSGENNNDININKIDHIETHSSNESQIRYTQQRDNCQRESTFQ